MDNLDLSLEPDLSFAQLSRSETLWGPHGYHRYPAKFIPQLVRHLIDDYSAPGQYVADPFLGSGTTAIEAVRSGRPFWGGDINPVATLISQAKSVPLDPAIIAADLAALENWLNEIPLLPRRPLTPNEQAQLASLNGHQREYWFPATHRLALATILDGIVTRTIAPTQTFWLCAFSNILRRCSLWLSGSTKPQKDITKGLADPIAAFRSQIHQMVRRNQLYWDEVGPAAPTVTIELADARALPLQTGSLELIVTSPPYATCYEYIALHKLTQLWLEPRGLLPAVNLGHTVVGSRILTRRPPVDHLHTASAVANHVLKALMALSDLPDQRRGSTIRREVHELYWYFTDMQATVQEFARIVAPTGRCILIIGDSRRRGITIPTAAVLTELAHAAGLRLVRTLTRQIPARVLVSQRNSQTGRFASVAESDSQVYPEEKILVFRP